MPETQILNRPQKNISPIIPDWTREHCRLFEWNSGKKLLRSIRDYQAFTESTINDFPLLGLLVKGSVVLRHRVWSVVSGADIPLNSQIGGGLMLPHPNGIVINPNSTIGPNCLLMSQVVIGTANGPGSARIGGHVDIGSGAKIIGPVSIGNDAKIGANAVVVKDVPSGKTAVGVPAIILESGEFLEK